MGDKNILPFQQFLERNPHGALHGIPIPILRELYANIAMLMESALLEGFDRGYNAARNELMKTGKI